MVCREWPDKMLLDWFLTSSLLFGWINGDVIVIYLCICFVFTLRGGWSLPTLDAGTDCSYWTFLKSWAKWKFWIDNIKTKHRNTLWPNVGGPFSGVCWTRLHTFGHGVCTDQGSTLTLDVQRCETSVFLSAAGFKMNLLSVWIWLSLLMLKNEVVIKNVLWRKMLIRKLKYFFLCHKCWNPWKKKHT